MLEGLFRVIPRQSCKLIVCWNLPKDDGGVKRIYAHFPTPEHIWAYVQIIPVDMRHFFEIIPGEREQKPHFDVDTKWTPKCPKALLDRLTVMWNCNPAEALKRLVAAPAEAGLTPEEMATTDLVFDPDKFKTMALDMRDTVIEILVGIGIDPRTIRVYSSNPQTGTIVKYSYHIVLPQYLCPNAVATKALYYYVNSKLPEMYREYLDDKVYSSLQQFRLFGSCKVTGPTLHKRLEKVWSYRGQEITTLCPYTESAKFIESLVSYIDPDEEMLALPYFPAPPPPPVRVSTNESAPEDIVQGALELLRYCDVLPDHCRFDKVVNNNLILLKRTKPNYCPICNHPDPHTGNNPYLVLRKVTPLTWEVLYYCRSKRADKRSLRLGTIKEDAEDVMEGAALDVEEVVLVEEPLKRVSSKVDYAAYERKMTMRGLMGLE
jgi:hypothetical protein